MAMEDASTCRVSADVLERLRRFVVTRWGDRATMSIATQKRKRIYALTGEGFISVIQQNDPDYYTVSANIPLCGGGAHGHFLLERACKSACQRRGWKPRKYGIMARRNSL